jgi:phosphoglycolate phosphatase-like HAD superfamily hydrolase
MTSVFAFDFDGVLFDTAHECRAIAFEAIREYDHQGQVALPDDAAELFIKYRQWVGPPWQYAALIECIRLRAMPTSREQFLQYAAHRESDLHGFTELYFATRERLSLDLARWTSHVRPYPAATAAFRALHQRGRALILSTRDARSITLLCAHFLDVDVSAALLPRAGDLPKWRVLMELAQQRGLQPPDVFFLDDYLPHALPAFEKGISARLALWGYLSDSDRAVASAAGLPCLELLDLDRALLEHEGTTS